MKKKLLICNSIIYFIMYHLGLFYVGFAFGKTYQFTETLWDRTQYPFQYDWLKFLYPMFFLLFLLIEIYHIRERDNLPAKAFVFLGSATWIPYAVLFAVAYMKNYADSSSSAYTYWFWLSIFVLASVIFVFDIICAIHTYREDRILKKKFETTS